MIGHYWHQYWTWAGSNIGAMPAEFIISALTTAVFGILLRKPIIRLTTWLHGRLHRDRDAVLAQAREDAAKARAIAADTYLHLTGEVHPNAPGGS